MWSFFAHVVEEVGIYGHHFRLARKVFKLVYRPLIPHRQTVNLVNERPPARCRLDHRPLERSSGSANRPY